MFADVQSYFTSTQARTVLEKSMYLYLYVIAALSFSISYIEYEQFKRFSSAEVDQSIKEFLSTLFEVVELVESKIRLDMKNQIGPIMHDGLDNNISCYFGLFALCMRNTKPSKMALR